MDLRHVRLITKREFLTRFRSPGFIIGTILGVLAIAALSFLPGLLSLLDRENPVKVAVVDPRNIVYSFLPTAPSVTPTPVALPPNIASSVSLESGLRFLRADTSDPNVLSQRVMKGEIGAYVIVVGTTPSDVSFVYHAKDRPGQLLTARLLNVLGTAATEAKLRESNISPTQAAALFAPPSLKVEPVVEGKLKDEKAYGQSVFLVYVLLVLLYGTILMYGIQVAMGVVEEKSSRVMEMLITTVRPIELMIGKVLGIGLLGLTQYALWVGIGLVVLLLRGNLKDAASGTGIDVASVPAATLLYFLVFFVLGYLLFAALYGALGSLVSRTEEVNSITAPLTMIMVSTYLLSIWALSNPDAELVRWLSFVPFFTPMLMFTRVALASPAWWEPLLAVLLLGATSLLFTWIASRIYRIGVLLYGKRPSFREIGRLLRAT